MILSPRSLRAMGLALALALAGPARGATLPPPRFGDPATWSSFEQCPAYLERWAGRDLPDWVVHSAIFSYTTRRPLYDAAGDPMLDAEGRQACQEVPATGRVFFPPSWRLLGRSRRLPLVLYPHATMLEKAQVPSEYGGHEWILGAAAAAYYGFAVAMPDLPGMGGDSQACHPFCHAKSLAYSTLDALPALERLAREDPYLVQRDYGWDGALYLLGYSEGAYAALAATRELETHPGRYPGPFNLKGSACMAGPFDLSGTTRMAIIDPVRPYNHCFYLPYVIMGYQGVYGEPMDPLEVFAPELLEQREDGNVVQWVGGGLNGEAVDALIGRRLGVPGDAVVLRSILNPDWVARQLEEPGFATSRMRKILLENDLWSGWRPTRPILFCQSLDDQEVPLGNTTVTMAALGEEIREAGRDPAQFLAFLPIGGGSDHITHVQGALVAIPAGFNWIYYGMPMD